MAGSVSCGVSGEYSDLGNNPSSFSTDWDKYISLDFSEYFISEYESFNITNDEITLSGWWFDNKDSEKTVVILHGVGSSKQSSGVLLSAGMLFQIVDGHPESRSYRLKVSTCNNLCNSGSSLTPNSMLPF